MMSELKNLNSAANFMPSNMIIVKLFIHGWRGGRGVANNLQEAQAKPGSKLEKANNPKT